MCCTHRGLPGLLLELDLDPEAESQPHRPSLIIIIIIIIIISSSSSRSMVVIIIAIIIIIRSSSGSSSSSMAANLTVLPPRLDGSLFQR